MELSPRDLALVQLVARFSQLAAPHVGEVVFGERSCTPLDRALARLVRHSYLRRIGRRSTEDRGRLRRLRVRTGQGWLGGTW